MAAIRERRGKFCVIYSCKDENGKRKQKWETYANKADARKRQKEIEYKATKGTIIIPRCQSLKELLDEYVNLYGKDKWSVSTYSNNIGLIHNYILPVIGETKLPDINVHFLETYYQNLLKMKAVPTCTPKKAEDEKVSASTIRDVHKLLRSCFEQAVKWELMEKNPAHKATVPKYKPKKRDIWTAETLIKATELCDDEILALAMHLAFSASLRIGELAALTWDCVDISPEAVEEGRAYIYVDKEFQRVSKEAIETLEGKDILLVFPSSGKLCTTVCVLKTPKTESSVRKVYIPRSVCEMLSLHRKEQEQLKDLLGSDYKDYNLVMATQYGTPIGDCAIRQRFTKFIKRNNLPEVVFHSLRHYVECFKMVSLCKKVR